MICPSSHSSIEVAVCCRTYPVHNSFILMFFQNNVTCTPSKMPSVSVYYSNGQILRPFDLAVRVKCLVGCTGVSCTFYLVASIKTCNFLEADKSNEFVRVKCIILMIPEINVSALPLCLPVSLGPAAIMSLSHSSPPS